MPTARPSPRTVLITGCSSGIGRATADLLRDRGWRVFAAVRRPADQAALAAAGFEAVLIDLDSSASIHLGFAHVMAATGGTLDALVSNAAYGQPGAVEDLSRDALRRQFESNLFGTVELANLAIPVMRAQGDGRGSGRLVFVSSILGLVAMPMRGAYNASKFALEGLADTLRMELRDTGIGVALVEPGAIESRFREHALEAAERQIDFAHSVHAARYERMRQLNAAPGGKTRGSLPPTAVAEVIRHALESAAPRRRYLVTSHAKLLASLKRILPASWIDALLAHR
jgi:NAD(P)-dependent dehydrogenase (short-subunit alcohol dehydrogenase family)